MIVISPNLKRRSTENENNDNEARHVDDTGNVNGHVDETANVNGSIEEGSDESVEAPCVGMVFSGWEEVETFIKRYGKEQGFGVTRAQGVKCKDKSKMRAITWKCECWGCPDMRTTRQAHKRAKEMEIGGSAVVDEGKKRKRRSKKCNCYGLCTCCR